jgi:hypothetical protein
VHQVVFRIVDLREDALAGGIVLRAVGTLGCRFVTSDLTQRTGGTWVPSGRAVPTRVRAEARTAPAP